MKRISMVLMLAGALFAGAAPAQDKKAAPVKKAAPKPKAASKPVPEAIPRGAREIEPGTFHYVDAKGQAWTYRKTPFGLRKSAENAQRDSVPVPTDWTVADAGDSVAFERPYPFGGKLKWVKKKSELSETEQAVWNRWHEAREPVKEEQ